jgi:hypothetical protein
MICYFKFWWWTGFPGSFPKKERGLTDLIKDLSPLIYLLGGCGCLALSLVLFWHDITHKERPIYGFF